MVAPRLLQNAMRPAHIRYGSGLTSSVERALHLEGERIIENACERTNNEVLCRHNCKGSPLRETEAFSKHSLRRSVPILTS